MTKRGEKRKRTVHWTQHEHHMYINFLTKKSHLLSLSLNDKKKAQPLRKMAEFIGSKDARQCRSHHQKMMKRHKSIDNIVKFSTEPYSSPTSTI